MLHPSRLTRTRFFAQRLSRLFTALTILLLTLTAAGCETQPIQLPWETPSGYRQRLELHLRTYINEEYQYICNYPNIFSTVEETGDGLQASADGASLTVTAAAVPEDMTIVDHFYETSQERTETPSTAKVFKNNYNYKWDITDEQNTVVQEGFMLVLFENHVAYQLEFRYPYIMKDEYSKYCDAMITRFLLYRSEDLSKEQIANLRDNEAQRVKDGTI